MNHEKILKREDGSQYKIRIDVFVTMLSTSAAYRVSVTYRLKGKKNWIDLPEEGPYLKTREERMQRIERNMYRFVTPTEVYQAKVELWNKLKPELQ